MAVFGGDVPAGVHDDEAMSSSMQWPRPRGASSAVTSGSVGHPGTPSSRHSSVTSSGTLWISGGLVSDTIMSCDSTVSRPLHLSVAVHVRTSV